MFQYFIKKLTALIPKLLIITVLIFFGMELMPGDAVTRTLNPEVVSQLSPEQIQALIAAKGLDQPIYIRYFFWLRDLLSGDLGYSLSSGTSVAVLLGQRLPATLELVFWGLLLSTVIGLSFGVISAIKKNTALDYSFTVAGMVGISIPEFFFGLLFLLVFAINLKWLPSAGRANPNDTTYWDHFKYLILPSLCLAIGLIANLQRNTRGAMLDVMGKDYIKTARAKGLRERTVYMKHCFRNGCAPVLLLLITRLGVLISGTTIIEDIFSYPGIGSLLLGAITTKDAPVAMGVLLLSSFAVLITTFIGDIVLAMLDPRIRFGKE